MAKRQTLRLRGMSPALVEQMPRPETAALTCEERLGLLVDRACPEREERRVTTRLRPAKLRQPACLEDLDYRQPRGLEKSLRTTRATGQWRRDRHNILLTGPTGLGTTWSACALGQQACRDGFTALSRRLPRLLPAWPMAQGDGRYGKLMAAWATTDVLSLDDGGLATLNDENRRELLELLDDRYDRRPTIVTSQLPVEHWHEALGAPTLAAAILDRLVHNADKMPLQGESMRQQQARLPRKASAD